MTPPSYEKINYALRPAKSIERKMIVETFAQLSNFYTMDSYRYIGLGSPYFSDLSLVHRSLGITDMICIEREEHHAGRFEFNKPYKCIELKFGESVDLLPELEWMERPTMIWLDYDDPMDSAILSDIGVVSTSLVSGSFLLVTVRNSAGDFGANPRERLTKLRGEIGTRLPDDVHHSELVPKSLGEVLWRIIDSEVKYKVNERSSGLRDSLQYKYEQILHFDYRDGARMLTVGGVIYQKSQRNQFTECNFASLPFSRTGKIPYGINPPPLTYKELKSLDSQLPGPPIPSLPGVKRAQIRAYAEHYRYFPNYVEADF